MESTLSRSPVLVSVVGLFFAAMGVVAVAIGINGLFWQGTGTDKSPLARQEAVGGELPVQGKVKAEASDRSDVPDPPIFDIARIDPGGNIFIAGVAVPGSSVAILDGGEEIATVTASERGDWVFMPNQQMSQGNHRLSLEMRIVGMGPVLSLESVVIMVPERDKGIVADIKTADLSQAMLPGIDTVDYGNSDKLFISGHAAANGLLKIYLDDILIGNTIADDGGKWAITPEPAVAPGVYTLRVEHLDTYGKLLAYTEIPFSRARPINKEPGATTIVVQPGNTLWAIARGSYGEGMQATVIYKANKKQIKDPDLIYPGQVFTIPAPRQGRD